MNNVTKTILVSGAGVLGTALISTMSYLKGRSDGFKLGVASQQSAQLGGSQQNTDSKAAQHNARA